jgi:hypothetical protein
MYFNSGCLSASFRGRNYTDFAAAAAGTCRVGTQFETDTSRRHPGSATPGRLHPVSWITAPIFLVSFFKVPLFAASFGRSSALAMSL